MIEKSFELAYENFKKYVELHSGEKLTSFKNNEFIDVEGYKREILKNAQDLLIRSTWKVEEIGSGDITKYVKRSLLPRVKYKGKTEENNLIDWRKVDDFKSREFDKSEEELFYNFFKSKQKPEVSFKKMEHFEYPYQLIAYLFFINNPQAYSPISQQKFDKIFSSLGLDFKTSHNVSWENYFEFNQLIKQTRKLLSNKHKDIDLIDAHNFLWIYGKSLEEITTEAEVEVEAEIKTEALIQDEDIESKNSEGREVYRLHRTLERDSSIGKLAKNKRLEKIGYLSCDVCEFNFTESYGEIGEGYIEAHHTIPVSEIRSTRKTKLSEIALVCANCHRMLHRQQSKTLSISDLKAVVSTRK